MHRVAAGPIRIADGFELAAQCAIKHFNSIDSPFPISLDNKEPRSSEIASSRPPV
ncbi:chaperonin [Culex quinquefasciatus]|uniref:Chaperonin n=1 Tax=Culex quinquefasciatus TaxID=7176 RepID=B0XD18_CULQU|nr:chaperonin [Culex quinquefasciatus]|eukprot:XP_001867540.1 chaperonin [Culex quinquefasciatus]